MALLILKGSLGHEHWALHQQVECSEYYFPGHPYSYAGTPNMSIHLFATISGWVAKKPCYEAWNDQKEVGGQSTPDPLNLEYRGNQSIT